MRYLIPLLAFASLPALAQQQSDCKVTPGKKTADSYSWQMSCPKTGTQGSGTVRLTGGTMLESDMRMTGDMQGRKLEMRTRMSGKRLGPCKS